MSATLRGKTAIVTGAAQGIGAAYARKLAELGATVVVADIDTDGAELTAKALFADGLSGWARRVDIADADDTAELARDVVDREGSIDILVNNAAIYKGLTMDLAEDIELGYWRRMMEVNVSGTFYMCRAVIPQMRRQRAGKIVNQSSAAAYLAAPLALHYCTSKAAVITMTKVLAKELGEDNINVNAIAPGVIDTEATRGAVPAPMQDMLLLNSALHRGGQPEDLLGALEFLCTSASDYMTGQTLVVDSGLAMPG